MDEQTDENTVNKVIKKGEELIKQGNTEFLNAKINEKDLAVLIFTSGTTSASKAVMLSQYNIAKNIHDMLMVEKFKSSDVNIAFLPYHHAFLLTSILHFNKKFVNSFAVFINFVFPCFSISLFTLS